MRGRRRLAWAACGAWSISGLPSYGHQTGAVKDSYDSDRRIESARLYGNINQYAYYFTDLLIGRPKQQRVSVIVDTGSSLCGFPCKGCQHCGHHIDPPFNFEISKSARWVPCGAHCQGNCLRSHCYYSQSYTEGSSISGLWFQDEVRLGDALQHNPPVNATLGCHHDERNLFYTQRVNGIMGMAPHRNSGRPTILQDLFGDKRHVNPDVFAMCLGEWGGELTVGGWQPRLHLNSSAVQWIPLTHFGYYSVVPQKLMIGDIDLGFGPTQFGTSLVDSGTTFTYFPGRIFRTLTAALIAACEAAGNVCHAHREGADCWRLDNGAINPGHFPSLSLAFGGGTVIQWPPSAYLFRRGEPNLWCHAFADNGVEPDTVLGVSWMLHKDVIFDLEHSRLGVAEAQCPEYRKAPGERLSPAAFGSPTAHWSWGRSALILGGLLLSLLAAMATVYAMSRRGQQDTQDSSCSWLVAGEEGGARTELPNQVEAAG